FRDRKTSDHSMTSTAVACFAASRAITLGSTKEGSMMRLAAARFARPTVQLKACSDFYRDLIGLPLVDSFDDHAGYSGRVFGLPDRHTQLELIQSPDGTTAVPHPENSLVLYFSTTSEFEAVKARVQSAGIAFAEVENPYWATV